MDKCNTQQCTCKLTPKNGMYMTPSDFPEWGQKFVKDYLNAYGEEIDIRYITFVVTERCPLRCTYCYEDHDRHKHGKTMTKETGRQIVDFIFDEQKINGYFDHNKVKGVVLDFIGGEPLLEIDLIDYIVDYFKYKAILLKHHWLNSFMINISSNGVLYFTEKVQKFLNKNKDLVSLGITIDGNKDLHDACRVFPDGSGSYDIVSKAIKAQSNLQCTTTTKITLSPENIPFISESIIHLWELGIDAINGGPVFENVWSPEDCVVYFDELIKLSNYIIDSDLYTHKYTSLFDEKLGVKSDNDKNFCGGTGNMLSFDYNGNAFPCLRYMQHSLHSQKEQPIGNLEHGMDGDENPFLKELKEITYSSQSPQKCIDCKVSLGCAWCSGYNYDCFGTPNMRATFNCEMHKTKILANYYYWNKLYKKLNIDKSFPLNIDEDEIVNLIGRDKYIMLMNM